MLTLFSCPKSFRAPWDLLQKNAIQSWLRLSPKPEVILLGDEEGMAEAAQEFQVRHLPSVARNEFGTPLINSMFEKAEKAATFDLLCFVNADIILMSDFVKGVRKVVREKPRSLLVGRRCNIDVREAITFDAGWEEGLKARVTCEGKLYPHFAIDYFVFPKGIWGAIPPFAIGRPAWDNWIIYRARSLDLPVVDLTRAVTVVHQNHDYSHHPEGWKGAMKGEESKRNIELAGEVAHVHSLLDANYYLTNKGLNRRVPPYYHPFYLYRTLVIWSTHHPCLVPLVRLIRKLGNRLPPPP